MGLALGIGSLLLGAVGTGIQYSAAQDAAKAQESFALLNSQAGVAQASMQARLSTAQAAFQAQQSANEQAAGVVNANALRSEAEQKTREGQINIARDIEDQRRFRSMVQAKQGASGTVGSTGSQLDLLSKEAELEVLANSESQYQTEQQRRQLFREAEGQQLGATYAGIQADVTKMGGEARASAYRAQGVQAQIQGLAGVSAARGASLAALGGAFSGFSNLATDAYGLKRMASVRWGGTGGVGSLGLTASQLTPYGA